MYDIRYLFGSINRSLHYCSKMISSDFLTIKLWYILEMKCVTLIPEANAGKEGSGFLDIVGHKTHTKKIVKTVSSGNRGHVHHFHRKSSAIVIRPVIASLTKL